MSMKSGVVVVLLLAAPAGMLYTLWNIDAM